MLGPCPYPCQGRGSRLYRSAHNVMSMGLMCAATHRPCCGGMLARVGAVAPQLRAHRPRLRRATFPCPHRAAIPLAPACRAVCPANARLSPDDRLVPLRGLQRKHPIPPPPPPASRPPDLGRDLGPARSGCDLGHELGVVWAQRRSRKPRPMRENPLRITFSAA